MSGFFARLKDAVRQLLLREPGPAGRAVAVSQVLISLAGVALVLLAPDPTFSLLFLAFIGVILGLFLVTPMMVMMFVLVFRASGV